MPYIVYLSLSINRLTYSDTVMPFICDLCIKYLYISSLSLIRSTVSFLSTVVLGIYIYISVIYIFITVVCVCYIYNILAINVEYCMLCVKVLSIM